MVGRGRRDRVDILAVEQVPHVGIAIDLDALVRESLHSAVHVILVRVTDRDVAHPRDLAEVTQVAAALRPDADGGDPDLIIGAEDPGGRLQHGQAGACGHGGPKEIPTRQTAHCLPFPLMMES
jgi:hypothetical protein